MQIFHDEMNADELTLAIERVARDVARMRDAGPLSIQEVQQTASALTRTQLRLNELVRIELRERGVHQDMAERIVALENRIRVLRDEIYREMQCRTAATDQASSHC